MSDSYMNRYATASPGWDSPVIIECQINGSVSREKNPKVPITYDEIAEDAIRCLDAGACAIHAHNTDPFLKGEEACQDYMKTWDKVLAVHPKAIWNPTLINPAVLDDTETGLEHIEFLAQHAGVRVGPVDPGATNLVIDMDESGELVGITYAFTDDQIYRQVEFMRKINTAITFSIYDPGYLRTAMHYVKKGMVPKSSSVALYLFGEYGGYATTPTNTTGLPVTMESLCFYLNMMDGCDLPWYLSIWGAGSMDIKPIMRRAVELGGHLKVGIESHYDPNRYLSNLELLQEAQEIVSEVGRPLAKPEEYYAILGQ